MAIVLDPRLCIIDAGMLIRLGFAALLVCVGCGSPPPLPPAPDAAGLPEQAAAQVRSAYGRLEAGPSAGESGRLGMLLHSYEHWRAAAEFYGLAAALEPDSGVWPYLLGVVEQQTGNVEAAELAFKTVLATSPNAAWARFRLAALLLEQDRLDEAEPLYEQLLAQQPMLAAAASGLGRIAALRGMDDVAIERFQQALDLTPELSSARYGLAMAYRRTGEDKRAAEEFSRYERLPKTTAEFPDPLLAQVDSFRVESGAERLARGYALTQQGLDREAAAEFEKALQADPELAEAHINLILSYGRLGDAAAAEKHYQSAAALGSDSPELFYNLGVLRFEQGRLEEAADAFAAALERNPQLADAAANLGVTLEQLDRRDAAMAKFRQALAANPDHRAARFHLGRNLLAMRHTQQALELLKGLERPADPLATQALMFQAQAYTLLGRKQEALRALRQAKPMAEEHAQQEDLALIEGALRQLQGNGE